MRACAACCSCLVWGEREQRACRCVAASHAARPPACRAFAMPRARPCALRCIAVCCIAQCALAHGSSAPSASSRRWSASESRARSSATPSSSACRWSACAELAVAARGARVGAAMAQRRRASCSSWRAAGFATAAAACGGSSWRGAGEQPASMQGHSSSWRCVASGRACAGAGEGVAAWLQSSCWARSMIVLLARGV